MAIFPATDTTNKECIPIAIVEGNISVVNRCPMRTALYDYTQQAMRNNGLLAAEKRKSFPGGKSPFKHVIYIIRENRLTIRCSATSTASGDGSKADGEPSVAIFGDADRRRARQATSLRT